MSQRYRRHVVYRHGLLGFALLLGAAASALAADAQSLQLGDAARPAAAAKSSHVVLLTDAATLNAGSPQVIELRFRVAPGLHINSHKPVDQFMIPTTLKLDPEPRLTVAEPQFPTGSPFRLKVAGGELLDVYQGEFRVAVRITAPRPGDSTLSGVLRYQACDNAACFPPRTLPVRVAVTAH